MTSPTEHSLALLRAAAWTVGIVERWIQARMIRIDFLGFADAVGCLPDRREIAAFQFCCSGDVSKRVTKIQAEPRASSWLAAGGRIYVIGWAKRGPRGKRKVWTPRIVQVVASGSIELAEADMAATQTL